LTDRSAHFFIAGFAKRVRIGSLIASIASK